MSATRFERQISRIGPRVLGYLIRRSGSPDDAADVYQAVLVTAWRKVAVLPAGDRTRWPG